MIDTDLMPIRDGRDSLRFDLIFSDDITSTSVGHRLPKAVRQM